MGAGCCCCDPAAGETLKLSKSAMGSNFSVGSGTAKGSKAVCGPVVTGEVAHGSFATGAAASSGLESPKISNDESNEGEGVCFVGLAAAGGESRSDDGCVPQGSC